MEWAHAGAGGLVRCGEEGVAMVHGLRRQEDVTCTQDVSTDWASLPWSGGSGDSSSKRQKEEDCESSGGGTERRSSMNAMSVCVSRIHHQQL